MKRIFFYTMLMTLATGSWISAKITLPHTLGSHMVMQQKSVYPLRGTARPNVTVTVTPSWSATPLTTHADSQGVWTLSLPTPEGSFIPHTLTFSDGESLTLTDLLIGDVWITAGQSNMEMPMKGNGAQTVEHNLEEMLAASAMQEKIRLFTVERTRSFDKELEDCGGEWQLPTPETVADFSAISYFFGRALSPSVPYPIGLLTTNWGDTRAEDWMPLADIREVLSAQEYASRLEGRWCKPSEMYCAMAAPLRGIPAKGFVWYQGESNLGLPASYPKTFQQLVKRWRADHGDLDNRMPFLYVQIAPYAYSYYKNNIAYPMFVEAQTQSLDLIPNSGMATTTDLGEERSIHPGKKKEIGERLAALALKYAYGMDQLLVDAPRLESFRIEEGKAKLTFNNAPRGLIPWTLEEITGFEIAGPDRVFHPAKAYTSDKPCGLVTVWSDEVKEPVAVRYCFQNWLPGNLRTPMGIPVAPFRTDQWNDVR